MVQGGSAVQLVVILLTVIGLWIGARLLVDSSVRLARSVGLSELAIGLTIVAVGTSTPEIAVSLDAALKGFGDIAVANVLGSNIYNLAFILGVVSLIRVIPVEKSLLHRDGVVLLASTAVGGAVVADLTVTRLDGAVLVVLFVAYTVYLLTRSDSDASTQPSPEGTDITRDLLDHSGSTGRDVALLVAGLAVVLVSGDLLIGAASTLARGAGISEWVIGGTIVAAGTSTPEFAVSLVAVRRGSMGVSVGNIVGSNIFNVLGVLGMAALVQPLAVSATALPTLLWLGGITVVVIAALWTGRKLSRAEGGLLAASELVRWALQLLGRF